MGRLNHLMGTITAQNHKRGLEQQQKNMEAEAAAVRRNVWQSDGAEVSDDEMGDNINLGDIYEQHYHTPDGKPNPTPTQPEKPSIAKTAALLGLSLLGAGAGAAIPIAAWNMTRPMTPSVTDTDTDTDTKYGLRIYRDSE